MRSIFLFSVLLILMLSCKTQNRQGAGDSIPNDTVAYEGDVNGNDSSKYCPELVREILKSSPRYKQLTNGLLEAVKKNGGTSIDIVMDKTPEPGKKNSEGYSLNYEMQVSESYPDRQVNLAHFSFDPVQGLLYEYDVVRDKLITIEFNKSLLDNTANYCK